MKMKPMGDRILLKKEEKDEKTKSGIILVDGIAGEFVYADVIAIGPGVFTYTGDRIPVTVKVGDTVVLHKSMLGGQKEIELDNEKYILVNESDIAMVSINGK